jgi:hypothetical protein
MILRCSLSTNGKNFGFLQLVQSRFKKSFVHEIQVQEHKEFRHMHDFAKERLEPYRDG